MNDKFFADFAKICRACLLTCDTLLDVPLKISNIFFNLTNIKIEKNDNLPDKLCQTCMNYLKTIDEFVEKCKTNHSLITSQEFDEDFTTTDLNDETNTDSSDDEPLSTIQCEINAKVAPTNLEKPKLQCNKCGKSFKLKRSLLAHFKMSHRLFKCIDCNVKFKSKQNLLKHQKEHGVLRSYKCDICRKNFKNLYIRNKHRKTHNRNGRRKDCKTFNNCKCTQCDRILSTQTALSTHMKTHTGEKPYSCTYCGKQFPYIGSLTVHTRLHTGETPYICDICNKGYRSSSSLKKHKVVKHYDFNAHIDSETKNVDKPLEDIKESDQILCKFCNKKFHKYGFGTHIRIHTIEKKKFVCSFCSKTFQKNAHLLRHIRIHTGERPFVCNICKKAFMQDGDLKRHLLLHGDRKLFQCQHCGKQYASKGALAVHISTHGEAKKRNFECKICKKPSKQCLHDKIHTGKLPFLCTTCGKSFTANGSLKVHTRIHTGEKPFVCSHCNKGFINSSSLKRHVIRNHTKKSPFTCMICQKGYCGSFELKRHVTKAHSLVEDDEETKNT